ncbi:MAG TPA: single-stranded-DNA-specific exonuclease RecJ, partial [bacterium]|nr:single-stranded-DNA-specific exonuclease RecJ [bacterium]
MKVKIAKKISEKVSKELEEYPEIIRQLLFNRKIETKIDAGNYFNPQKDFGDPSLLYGIQAAVDAILQAIEKKKKIFIHGDFDVDGVSATSLLWNYLYRELEADIIPYIPSRFDEGYGMSDASIEAIMKEGADMIITVDCGVKDIDLIKK